MPLVGEQVIEESSNSSDSMELAFENLTDEIIEDAIFNLCFKVHRAVKMGYFTVDGHYLKEKESDNCGEWLETVFSPTVQREVTLVCPHCQKKVGAYRFAPHLNSCMCNVQRVSSRKASRRFNNLEVGSDIDDDENVSDYGSSKKRTRKKLGKNSPRRIRGKHSGDTCVSSVSYGTPSTSNYLDMPYEQKKDYLDQMCGVISKHTHKMCMNTLKCSQHSEDQRRELRQVLLTRSEEEVQVDVDAFSDSRSPSPTDLSDRNFSLSRQFF